MIFRFKWPINQSIHRLFGGLMFHLLRVTLHRIVHDGKKGQSRLTIISVVCAKSGFYIHFQPLANGNSPALVRLNALLGKFLHREYRSVINYYLAISSREQNHKQMFILLIYFGCCQIFTEKCCVIVWWIKSAFARNFVKYVQASAENCFCCHFSFGAEKNHNLLRIFFKTYIWQLISLIQ